MVIDGAQFDAMDGALANGAQLVATDGARFDNLRHVCLIAFVPIVIFSAVTHMPSICRARPPTGRNVVLLLLISLTGQALAVTPPATVTNMDNDQRALLDVLLRPAFAASGITFSRRFTRVLHRHYCRARARYSSIRQAPVDDAHRSKAASLIARTWHRHARRSVDLELSPCKQPVFTGTSSQVVCLSILRTELADALELSNAQVDRSELRPRQAARTVVYARRREASRLAWTMLCHVPQRIWIALSFCYRLRARAVASDEAIARRARSAVQAVVLELYASPPSPMTSFDVGVAHDNSLLYRSACGIVKPDHPSSRPMDHIVLGSAIHPDGSSSVPLQPPATSPIDLCPDASGAICYVNRDDNTAHWDAPPGSTALVPRPLLARSLIAPPRFPPGLAYEALHGTQWHPLYQDRIGRVVLYNAATGAVREGPWLCSRSAASRSLVFFINLITQDVRWFPPHRWMEGWISRPSRGPDGCVQDAIFDGHKLGQLVLPLALARQRADGGAPPELYERGVPQYPPDEDDTPDTHPLA